MLNRMTIMIAASCNRFEETRRSKVESSKTQVLSHRAPLRPTKSTCWRDPNRNDAEGCISVEIAGCDVSNLRWLLNSVPKPPP